jgi:hypothetical protein
LWLKTEWKNNASHSTLAVARSATAYMAYLAPISNPLLHDAQTFRLPNISSGDSLSALVSAIV